MAKSIKYVEPADYFPKEIRKKMGIGEYAKDENSDEKRIDVQESKTAKLKSAK